MCLRLNLSGITLKLDIQGYHQSNIGSQWCQTDLYLHAPKWLDLKVSNKNLLVCFEIDQLEEMLSKSLNKGFAENTPLKFIAPDLSLYFTTEGIVYFRINLWHKSKVSDSHIQLALDKHNVCDLHRYIKAVIDSKPFFNRPLCLDELSDEQLEEELEKGLSDIQAGRVLPADEVFDGLRKSLRNNGDETNEYDNN